MIKIRNNGENISRERKKLCKKQNKQLKDLAAHMGIDPASLNRAMYGNARLDTIEKIAKALNVPIKTLFESLDNNEVEGYIKIKGKIFSFSSKDELFNLLNG